MPNSRVGSRFAVAVLLIATAFPVACKSDKVTVPPPDETVVVTVTPANTQLAVGQTTPVAAQVTGGDANTDRNVQWTATPSGLVTLTPNGNVVSVLGVAPGTATVTATHAASGKSASATIQVSTTPATVDHVDVLPPNITLAVGDTLRLAATARDVAGNTIGGKTVAWASLNAGVASVTSGLVRGIAAGTTSITATVDGRTGLAGVTVTAPPAPGRYAYAYADNPLLGIYTAGAGSSYNFSGAAITIQRLDVGRYSVFFPGLQPPLGESQIIQITAHGTDPVTCKPGGVSSSVAGLTALVYCFNAQDVPTDQTFLILVLGSGALPGRFAFAWADQPALATTYTPAQTWNATSQSVNVTRTANGTYTVNFTGNARPQGGTPEATFVMATGTTAARCTPASLLTGSALQVRCTGPAGVFVDDDAPFMTVLVEKGVPGRRFAIATVPAGGAFAIIDAYSSSGGAITATPISVGRTDVTFAGLGRTGSNGNETVMIEPQSNSGAFCKLLDSQTIANNTLLASVYCFSHDGVLATQDFRILVLQ